MDITLHKGIKTIETVNHDCMMSSYDVNNVMVGNMGVRQTVEYSNEQDPICSAISQVVSLAKSFERLTCLSKSGTLIVVICNIYGIESCEQLQCITVDIRENVMLQFSLYQYYPCGQRVRQFELSP